MARGSNCKHRNAGIRGTDECPMVQAVIDEKVSKLLTLRCKEILICFKAILSPQDIHVRFSDV